MDDDIFRPLTDDTTRLAAPGPTYASPNLSDGHNRHGEPAQRWPAAPHLIQQNANATDGGTVLQAGDTINWITQQLRWLPQVALDEEVERARVGFAPPPQYDEALARLTRDDLPIVVVCGPRNSGRRTCALNLLADGQATECLTDWESIPLGWICFPENPPGVTFSTSPTSLRTFPSSSAARWWAMVPTWRALEQGMVILVTERLWRACRPHAQGLTVDLGMPASDEVLTAHLLASRDHLDWIAADERLQATVAELVTNDPRPGRAAELAAIVRRQTTHDETAVKAIRDEFHHWGDYLAAQLSEHESSKAGEGGQARTAKVGSARSRALLISVAVLDGAPTETVLDASEELLRLLRATPEPSEILVGPELSDLIQGIEAERRGDTLTITGRHPGLDQAVLSRIWRERPRLRAPIRTWLAGITAEKGPAANELRRVADVLANLATQLGSLEVLDILQRWMIGSSRHRQLGITVLEQLAVSPEVGAVVRRRLYDWARGKADVQLLTGVAEVCAGKLGRQSPAAALSRLRWLFSNEQPVVRDAASQALRALATDDKVRPHVMAAVADWFTGQDPAAGQLGLLALIDPGDDLVPVPVLGMLAAEPELRTTVHRAWSTMIEHSDTRASAMVVVRRWLACADEDKLDAGFVIELLAPILRQALPGDDFKQFITHGEGSRTHADLVMTLVLNRFSDSRPPAGS